MAQHSADDCFDIIHRTNLRFLVRTIRAFKRLHRWSVNASTVKFVIKKLEQQHFVKNRNRTRSRRPKTSAGKSRSHRCSHRERSREISRRIAAELDLPKTSVHHVIRGGLSLYPYRVQILQQQTEANKFFRLDFCGANSDETVLSRFQFSYEANFHLSGHINKQNISFLFVAFLSQRSSARLRSKLAVWCAIGYGWFIGPYFFKTHVDRCARSPRENTIQ